MGTEDGFAYERRELSRVLSRGPSAGDDHFRMKVTGLAETRWLNVSRERLRSLVAAFSLPGGFQRRLAFCDRSPCVADALRSLVPVPSLRVERRDGDPNYKCGCGQRARWCAVILEEPEV